MNAQRLTKNYNDAHVARIVGGPRREVTLYFHLDPVWNQNISETAVVHFGVIANYQEVEEFFSQIPAVGKCAAFIAEVRRLEESAKDNLRRP